MKTADDIKGQLKCWLLARHPAVHSDQIAYDTELLVARLITSLHIVELILEIEKIKGARCDMKKLKPGVFVSIDSIHAAFFSDAS